MPFLPIAPLGAPKTRIVTIWCHDCQTTQNEVVEGHICWCCDKDLRPPRVHRERG